MANDIYFEKLRKVIKGRVLVCIDAANLERSVRDMWVNPKDVPVSGDCDFEYLLKFLRGQGKIAIVFSHTGHVAKELLPAASYYFDAVDFRHDFLKVHLKKAKNPA